MKKLFTSESVTVGHPDKLSDQIADAILDDLISQDEQARVAVEVMLTVGTCFVAGEITTSGYADILGIARQIIKESGYTKPEYGFHWQDIGAMTAIHGQSSDIAQGVDSQKLENLGAGDQGCLKKGTLIRTKRGYLPIEQVMVGNYVLTPLGWRRVLKSVMTGRKKVIGVKFANGSSLECTPDHKILCYDRRGTTYWKAAGDLRKGEFVCAPKPAVIFTQNQEISLVRKNQFFSKYNHKIYGPERMVLDNNIGYLLGELIGDGSVRKQRQINLAFGVNLQHAQKVQKLTISQMPRQWKIVKNSTDGNVSLQIASLVVRKHFENFGLSSALAHQKITPTAIFFSPLEVIRSYLQGLFDADGTIVSKTGRNKQNIRIRLSSSSPQLLRETQLLLKEFKIKSNIFLNVSKGWPVGKRGPNGKRYKSKYDNFVLNIVGFESYQRFCSQIGFLDQKKQERSQAYLKTNFQKPVNSPSIWLVPHPTKKEMIDENRLVKKFPFSILEFQKKEEKEEICEVYDLEVEDIHIFSANGVFVHNSVFGYACTETKELMPLPIVLAHRLARRLQLVREKNLIKGLRPDGKSQVTLEYEDDKPKRVVSVVVAAQHDPDKNLGKLRDEIARKVIEVIIPKKLRPKRPEYIINATGKFVVGGPQADTGATGRKNIVDTYGGAARHGGGSLSGKDPSKVDRSGQYAARYVAKNIVAAGLAQRCEVQIGYAIGTALPLSILVETFGTSSPRLKEGDEDIASAVSKIFDLRPGMIIKNLKLRRPIYRPLAAYGHFGRPELNLPWERVDKVAQVRKALKFQSPK